MNQIKVNNQNNILLDKEQVTRFQILVYCYLNGLLSGDSRISHTDIDCLTLIGIRGKGKLLEICNELVEYGVCGSAGYARGVITRMQDMKLICKDNIKGSSKVVYLNPMMNIQEPTNDMYLMDINYRPYDPQKGR